MAVPDFQSFLRPVLAYLADGEVRTLRTIRENLASSMGLTDDELSERLPSGTQSKYDNRVAWAVVYLAKARALSKEQRAHYRITDRGRYLLEQHPARIDVKTLRQYPEFAEFHKPRGGTPDDSEPDEKSGEVEDSQTPEERMESGFQDLNQTLASELLQHVKTIAPDAFERLVVRLLVRMGYGGSIDDAGRAVGQTGDEGIDGIIKEDKLGLDSIYIQAKRWADQQVGSRGVREFIGSLSVKRARKGVLITTSTFSPDALKQAHGLDMKVVLIDGRQLAELMIEHNVGVSEARSFVVKRLDPEYFDEL